MDIRIALLASALLVAATPLFAQSVEKENAVNAVEGPVTQSLNNQVENQTVAKDNAVATTNADAQAQYEADKQAYWAALSTRNSGVARNDAHYLKLQEAYAAAMRDWRIQVYRCKTGHQRACDMPTPNPAAYM